MDMAATESGASKSIEIPKIQDSTVEDITNLSESYRPVSQRYYDHYLWKPQRPADATSEDVNQSGDQDHVILLHSNRVCLVSLAPTHPVVKERKKIKCLDFDVTGKKAKSSLNRLDNKASGKGKKGAQAVDEKSILCWIETESDNVRYPVRSCVRGKLVEINERVIKNPQLIVQKPLTEGHIAIILPKLPEGLDDLKKRLVKDETRSRGSPLSIDD